MASDKPRQPFIEKCVPSNATTVIPVRVMKGKVKFNPTKLVLTKLFRYVCVCVCVHTTHTHTPSIFVEKLLRSNSTKVNEITLKRLQSQAH